MGKKNPVCHCLFIITVKKKPHCLFRIVVPVMEMGPTLAAGKQHLHADLAIVPVDLQTQKNKAHVISSAWRFGLAGQATRTEREEQMDHKRPLLRVRVERGRGR